MITVLFLYRPVAWCFLRGMKFLSILVVGVALATSVVADQKAETERLKKETKALKARPKIVRSGDANDLPPLTSGKTAKFNQIKFKIGTTYLKGEKEPFTGYLAYLKREKEPFTGTQIGYFSDGTKKHELPYVNGIRHGTVIEYHNDGSKLHETPYLNGKKHGTVIEYHKDGSKRWETPYLNDRRHGRQIWYNEDGSKRQVIVYKNGKKISEEKY